uniref:Myosinlike protein putative n=1 Tax=Albugo laibachii Nc14 TaxID=890382 RepID=F0W5Y9_9STRA|nr:myosinlike protein putative [Albugo laibachii Nc14]|eukprot:CCA16530.1 myosinlike protein putative [Albugo laibachii Nc14]
MPIALVRVEELEEWISQVTSQDVRNEHLSVTLQNGQVLCHLVNALDGTAKLRINRLTTVFHSKSNINLFLTWCRAQGMTDGELFETNDLLETRDFQRVIATLSILYDQYDGVRYSQACNITKSPVCSYENDDGNSSPSDDDFDEDLTRTQYISKAGSKLSSFVKGNFLSVKKKKGKLFGKSASQEQGTPCGTPPPSTPCPEDEINTENIKPKTPAATTHRQKRANSKLETFLEHAPPANAIVLEQSARPVPTRKKSSSKEPSLPKSDSTQSQTKKITQSMKGLRAKASPFASFSNKDNRKKLSEYMKNNSSGMAAAAGKQSTKPQELAKMTGPLFKDGKAMKSFRKGPSLNKQVKEDRSDSSSSKKPETPTKPTKNNLKDFIAKQPPVIATGPRLQRTQSSKLAAFLAKTEISPKAMLSPDVHFMSSPDVSPRQDSPISTPSSSKGFNPVATSSFSPQKRVQRSTGKGNYIRKRQTYRSTEKRHPIFSLEDKRRKFMEEQLIIKDEQLRSSSGDTMKQNLIVPGVHCYVPDDENVWLPAQIIEYDQKYHQVDVEVTLDDGEIESRHINLNNRDVIRSIAGLNATSVESLPIAIQHDNTNGVEDMRLLRFLNEPSILFNLKKRFESSQPYTYSTDIVIALNPYKWIDNLYGHDTHAQYLKMDRDKLTPHVYATSSAAYKHMIDFEMNQSILVSGESGAGKTETTKIVMNHLASVTGGRKDKTIAKVIDVNPLLESFGNARTTRNDNSSRFGKFTQLQFDTAGKLIGAKCQTYLLEKSRVVSIADQERNYHIFYQMLAGFSRQELKEYHLDQNYDYMYLKGTVDSMQVEGTDDAQLLASTRKSLSLVGLSPDDQRSLFQILSGILHLGEITFADYDENGSVIANLDQLEYVAKALGLEISRIEDVFCNRSVVTRNERLTVPLDPVMAEENRDGLAKAIYSKLFDWMVLKINEAISTDDDQVYAHIGVLDIFGFEDFAQNGFEQFCINYANEKLQQKFTLDVFKTVEEEYVREGLKWDHIEYQDNQAILDIIDGKMGIIALMNDHLRQPRGTEEALVNKFRTNLSETGKNPHIRFPKTKRTQFAINHYAGTVTYESVGFMEKHRDSLQNDLFELVLDSSVDLLTEIFDSVELRSSGSSAGTPRGKKTNGAKSLGSQFKMSLSYLMDNISSTNVHYIRCIKPNANKSPTEFDKGMVVEQLRSAGVIEAIRITRSGYPSRLTPDELAKRYCIMFPPSLFDGTSRKTCADFMSAVGRKSPLEYQIGKSLIYFKSGVLEELEAMKSDFYYDEATCIQKIVLGFLERRRLERKIRAAILVQSLMRMELERVEYKLQRRAIVSIQRCWRRYLTASTAPEEVVIVETPAHFEEVDSHETNDVQTPKVCDEDVPEFVFDDPVTDGSDVSYESSNGPATPPRKSKTLKDRFNTMRQKVNLGDDFSTMRSLRANSVKRMGELTESAQRVLDGIDGQNNTMSLEEENATLKAENRNLHYDLEMMREQCIELQSIIVEINRSRKRYQ